MPADSNVNLGFLQTNSSSEDNDFYSDSSRAQSQASGNVLGAGAVSGSDLKLVESSGNTFNLADPTATIIAGQIARDSIGMAYGGLERITDTSNLAVTRALDLAKTVQGGQGEQVSSVVKTGLVAVAVGALIFAVIRMKGK